MLPRASDTLALADDEIQVWSASLNYPADQLASLSALLSEDEKARAARLYFDRDRQRYIAGRGLLRLLLGGYLGVDAASLTFRFGPQGKPALADDHQERRLEFNLAHSRDLALYALRWDWPVGVDVEYVHLMLDQDGFARYYFSANECALMSTLSGREKTEAFFKIWTCKEAILKALGSGLTMPMDLTEVALEDSGSVRMLALDGDAARAGTWHLQTFEPAPGYRGSLASEGPDWRRVLRQIDGNVG